jgi:hypothetical protein
MSIIYCYYVIDVMSLFEHVSTGDIRVLHVNHFQTSPSLSQQQVITHSQYFEYKTLSGNLNDWYEWISEGRSHFKYV